MPSRRQLLAGGGLALAGVAGRGVLETPRSIQTATSSVDWPMARFDAAGTAFNPAASGPSDDPQVRWERDLDASVLGPAAPILVGDTLFLVGDGALLALERDRGRIRFERSGYSYLSAPTRAAARAYRSDTLAVQGRAGIYGLSADGGYAVAGSSVGLERWHAPGSEPSIRTSASPTPSSLVAADGTIYAVVPETNRVVAIDASSGRVRWEYAVGDERSSHPNRPAVLDGTVYVTSWPDYAVALDAESGEPRWEVAVEPEEPERPRDYREVTPPTATSEGLVVPSRRAISLLDPDTGDLEWEYVHDGTATDGSVAVSDGMVFATDGDDELHAVDLDSGEGMWTAEYRPDVSPVVADGVVYLAYAWLPEVVAVDATTGERRWTREVGHGPSQPIVGDGVLYVVAHDRVVALEEGS